MTNNHQSSAEMEKEFRKPRINPPELLIDIMHNLVRHSEVNNKVIRGMIENALIDRVGDLPRRYLSFEFYVPMIYSPHSFAQMKQMAGMKLTEDEKDDLKEEDTEHTPMFLNEVLQNEREAHRVSINH